MTDSDVTTKVCSKCGQPFPATTEFFSPHTGLACGLQPRCKKCRCEDAKADYARRPEIMRARKKKDPEALWTPERKARARTRRKKYRADHLADSARRTREYVAKHHEEVLARQRQRRQDHIEEERARARRSKKKHPESGRVSQHNRRARVRQAEGSHGVADIKAQYSRQKGKCFYCGVKVGKKYHVDHVVPLVLGGSNGPENLVIACADCNQAKNAKHPMDFCGRLL